MKAILLSCAAVLLLQFHYSPLAAQPWHYHFGSTVDSCSSGVSTTVLPAPPVGSARVRIGSQGGSVALVSPGYPALGSDSELHLHAPRGGSLNKVQLHSIPQGSAFTVRATLRIDGGPGVTYFFVGSGSCFQNNSGFTSAEVFAGIRWTLDSSSAIATALRLPSGWTTITPNPCTAGTEHMLELYCNNTAVSKTYMHDSSCVVAARSLDFWVDGVRIGHDVAKTGLPDTAVITAFMFYAANSVGNSASLSVDDIFYENDIASVPLPVELSAFTVRVDNAHPLLQWTTETEVNNHGFTIERRHNGEGVWEVMGFVQGRGDTQTPHRYCWIDSAAESGNAACYRLRQIDRDGTETISDEVCLEAAATMQGCITSAPWPQPARELLHIPLQLVTTQECTITITTLSGEAVTGMPVRRILPAGRQLLTLPCSTWPRGVLLCVLRLTSGTHVIPLLLI